MLSRHLIAPLLLSCVLFFFVAGVGLAQPRARVLPASDFRSNGSLISGWYWLRSPGHEASWTFDGSQLAGANRTKIYVLFHGLITNGVNGGAGWSTTLRFRIGDALLSVPTFNPYRPQTEQNSFGIGYDVYGHSSALSAMQLRWLENARYVIRLKFPDWVISRYHVAVNKDALAIGYIK